MSRADVLKSLRLAHLYVGVFIAPALLFFALTGALQTLGLHETNGDHPNYIPARWIVVLGQIHKKQTNIIPVRKPSPPQAPKAAQPPTVPASTPAASTKPQHKPLLLRPFFLLVCLGLFTSTLSGLSMAYLYNRNKLLITLTLLAGVVLPPLLLLL